MNIYRHELRAARQTTITWTLTMIGLTILFFSFYPAYSHNAEVVKSVFAAFPAQLLSAAGIDLNTLFTLNGFYAYIFTYITLAGAIQAMNLGLNLLGRESREHTVDFLLTRPVSRTGIISSKLLAALTSLVITNGVFFAGAITSANLLAQSYFNYRVFLLISLTLFFIQVMFVGIGLLLSVILKKVKSVTAVSLGTVIGFFLLSGVGSALGDINLAYLTPFKYFDTHYILVHEMYDFKMIILAGVLVVTAIFISYLLFIHQDIPAN